MANINLTVGTSLDKKSVQDTQAQLSKISQQLKNELKQNDLGSEVKKYEKALKEVEQANKALGRNFSETFNKFNVDGFVRELKSMGINVDSLSHKLEDMGFDGVQSLEKFTRTIKSSQVEIVKTQSMLEKTSSTLAKTFVWSMANRTVDMMTNSIQQAIGYTKQLDESLTNIAIVTSDVNIDMEKFADSANSAASALGKTTLDYTEAALLYLQQGRTLAETSQLVEATLMGANITGEATANMSELLTAALNGYNLSAKDAMDVTDKFAKVGATTGSDFNELATAFSKTASMANIVGVTFDELTAQIATISTVTREAPESIGTSLKTIYGRMTEIKSLGKDDEGMTFGGVKETLDAVGISIIEADGKLRDMGQVIEDVGGKWADFDRNTQVAIANALAGSRQANRLIALFQNWGMYQDALEDSVNSSGAAMEQNEIYMDSLEAKSKQLRAAMEDLWMSLIDSGAIKTLVEGLTAVTQALTTISDMIGGLIPIITSAGVVLTQVFGTKIMFQGMDSIKSFGDEAKKTFSQNFGKDVKDAITNFDSLKASIISGTGSVEEFGQAFRIPKENLEQLSSIQESIVTQKMNKETLGKNLAEQNTAMNVLNEERRIAEAKVASAEALRERKKEALQLSREENIAEMKTLTALKEKIAVFSQKREDGTASEKDLRRLESFEKRYDNLNIKAEEYRDSLTQQTAAYTNLGEVKEKQRVQAELIEGTQIKIGNATKDLEIKERAVGDVLDKSLKSRQMALNVSKAISYAALAGEAIKAVQTIGSAIEDIEGRGNKIGEVVASGIGAGIGFYFGGPMGATLGANLGRWISSLFDFKTPLEKAYAEAEKYSESLSEFETQQTDLSAIAEEIEGLEKINSEYERKNKEVEISNRLAEIAPDLVQYYDAQGNAVIDLTQNIKELIETREKEFAIQQAGGKEAYETKQKNELVSSARLANTDDSAMSEYQSNLSSYLKDYYKQNEVFQELGTNVKSFVGELLDSQELMQSVLNYGEEGVDIYFSKFNSIIDLFSKADQEAFAKVGKDQLTSILDLVNGLDLTAEQTKSVMENLLPLIEQLGEGGYLSAEQIKNAFMQFLDETPTISREIESLAATHHESTEAMTARVEELKSEYSDLDRVLKEGLDPENAYQYEVAMSEILALVKEYPEVMAYIKGESYFNEEATYAARLNDEVDKYATKMQEMADLAEFKKSYDNPYLLDDSEYNKALDQYQTLYNENEKFVELLNDASVITFDEEGNPLSSDFNKFIDRNVESTEDYMEAMSGLTQVFGDLNQKDLKEMFGADIAADLAEVFDVVRSENPFEAMTENSQLAVDSIMENFTSLEDKINEAYLKIHGTDSEFYEKLRANNVDYFDWYAENLNINSDEYSNYAEFKAATDKWYYDNLINGDEQTTKFIFDNMVALLDAEEQAAVASLTSEEQKQWMIANLDKEKLTTILTNKKEELIAQRDALQKEINNYNQATQVMDADNQALAINALNYFNQTLSNVSATGALDGTGLSSASGTGVTQVVNIATQNLASLQSTIDSIDAALGKLELPDIGGLDMPTFNKPERPGGTSKPTTGKKPSSSQGKKDKVQEDLEIKKDIYHDINIELKKQNDLLSKLKATEKDLYGQDRIDNLNQQADAIKRISNLTEQKLALAKQEAKEARDSLSKMGVSFGSEGEITNYNDIIQSKLTAANAITDADAKKAAQDSVKALQKALDDYDKLQFDVIFGYENELKKFHDEIQDTILSAIAYEYEFNIEASVTFKEDVEFFEKFLEGFEELPDTIERAMSNFNSQYDALDAFATRYESIMANEDLDPLKKAEALEELKKDFQDALLSLKDVYEAINSYIQKSIENNVDAIYDHIEAFKNVNEEISDMISMYELLGKAQDYDAINAMLDVQADSNRSQIEALRRAKKEMESFRDALEEGTDEWKKANEAVEKMDGDIRKLALDTVKLYQEQLENSFKKSINEIEKALSGGLGFDKLEKEISKARKEQEKYYDAVEKTLWASKMQKDIQEQINKATDPKKKEALQKFYDTEVATLLDKEKLTKTDVERAELLYEITMKQMALEEARANKTIMRLVRDEQGNWTYQYMTDLSAVQNAQEDLSASLDKLMQHDKKVYEQTQDEILERRKEFISDMQELFLAYKNGEIKDEDEFNKLMAELQNDFNEDMFQLNSEFAVAERNLAESTLASICNAYDVSFGDLQNLTDEQKKAFEDAGIALGESWDSTVDGMVQNNDDFLADLIKDFGKEEGGAQDIINKAMGNMSDAVKDYGKVMAAVTKQAGMDIDSMGDRLDDAKKDVEKLTEKTDDLVEAMNKEFTEIKDNLLPMYDKIKDKFLGLQTEVQKYIDKIKAAITEQKKLYEEQNKPPTTTNKPGSTNPPTTTTPPAAKNPAVGDVVSKVSGTWYYDSDGTSPTGNPTKWAKQFKVTSHKPGKKKPYHIQGTNGGTGSGWVDYVAFKTGGYTGDWSKSDGMDKDGGKLALLHQKEMVLNADDTQNILDSVALVREFAQSLKLPTVNVPTANGDTKQEIHINADFSGVKSANEIELAFDNLQNRAAQYARQLRK